MKAAKLRTVGEYVYLWYVLLQPVLLDSSCDMLVGSSSGANIYE